ncbi:MAG: dihydroorotate dehydrogenase [Candidatus Infernicultor aquiphilus]|uniref:Dihydroorotate dehydrogenase n=1 Tax=Candidatus Infernicultor aquiphilus TaxID=1805029 RepID=A0A2M7PNB5_9BACT|nr:dihydroorotate dehydrogenase [bacterium]PIU25881.1 MAG: dihydroorotate dehydrogenase [Candidatus Atribacteria bacterium CG08_land_8_20_14_0_20_33_29]PIW12473.1 MAG: dihydroorotate dehydrogenase [Candidatus Atribacteria bacterium CG17_big_fil_post_rev_8_21_14_2_50_34_11]PIY31842.1 MAG: dihydroorotate dehydrogenase [Candidatus Atribacteria bacterium CG_4_10_14_3_um_filter_34_13]PJB57927.1 MAG: dihydroorotate dehydrogenase [Candidatus Atribacteria bacterium CG_4_9_14_3_um_filter_33_16]
MTKKPRLEVEVGGIRMKNPVMTASGTFGYGEEFSPFIDLDKLGAIVLKGITLKPKRGNPPPRIIETPSGILNAIGLQNVGVEVLINKKLPYLQKFTTPVIINISGDTLEEYVELARKLDNISQEKGIAGLEINISCPNLQKGGIVWGSDAQLTYKVVNNIRKVTTLPLIVKLSPNVTDIKVIAHAAEEAGADVLSLINTLVGMAVDVSLRRPKLANISGGLSGPAVKPVALWMVWQVFQTVNIPIIGMGGIMKAEDALEFIIAGARAVSIGTANLVNPQAAIEIIKGIEAYLVENKIKDINELVGSLKI